MFRALSTIALLPFVGVAMAQERIADYDNSIRLEYQYIKTGDLNLSAGVFDIGATETHVLLLSGVYSLNERWKIYGSIPYVQKRHDGNPGGIHDPLVDFVNYTPPDLRFVDDGDYHGGFQDFYVGTQYLAIDGPFFTLSPFVSYGTPASDYPIYGNAIIGRGVWEVPVGVSMEFTPYFSDWYFQADIAYVFSEKLLGVDLNYWLTYFSASYFFTPRFAPRIFVTSRNAPNALVWEEDFEPYEEKYDNENGWRHDQTLKHNYVNWGLGFDYILSDHYEISATWYTTWDPEEVEEVDLAFTVGLMYKF